ncbi:MAG: hypothetical protein AVDCRST_MAG64-780, partial [uncultured Phycisphaerae bacterium]
VTHAGPRDARAVRVDYHCRLLCRAGPGRVAPGSL